MTTSDELRKRREKEAVRIRTSLNRLRGEQRASIKGGESAVAFVDYVSAVINAPLFVMMMQ